MIVWALHVCVVPSAAEAALRMNAIREAPKHAVFATVVPEIWHGTVSKSASADVHLRVWPWAMHRLEGRLAAIPALIVHAVSFAAEHPRVATWLEVVRHCWNDIKGAHLRGRARDERELALAAMTTLHVLTVGIAAVHPQETARLPISWRRWLRSEGASSGWGRLCAFWTRDCGVGEVPTEAALGVDPVREAAQIPFCADVVPIVRKVGLLWELAATGRALDRQEVAATTKSTLHMPPVCIATESTHLSTCWVPERANAVWLVVELTLATDFSAFFCRPKTN